MAKQQMTKPPEQADTSLWPMTDRSRVQAAGDAVGKETKPLDELYTKYKGPLYVHLVGKFRSFPPVLKNADDLLQDFALKKILGQGWLLKWHPSEGRFRDFLRRSLNNFVLDWWRRQPEYQDWKSRQKNPRRLNDETSGLAEMLLVELPSNLPAPTPEAENFNLSWAQTVLAQALDRLEQACKDSSRDQPRTSYIWEVFRLRTLDPIFTGSKPASYDELVKRFELRSPTEGSNMLLSAKRMFKRHIEDVISEYAGSDKAAQSELEELAQFVERIAKKRNTKR